MPIAFALILAAALAAGDPGAGAAAGGEPALSASAGSRLPPVSAPQGRALSVEGHVGGAACGFCGAVLGVAASGRAGPAAAGAFAEVAFLPVESFPSSTAPAVVRSALFAGGFGGVALRVGRRARVELDAELGVQRGHVSVEFLGGDERRRGETVPFAGARAKVELPFTGDAGALGVSAFVREPLRDACVETGLRCERLGTTVGLALHGSIALVRRGTAPRAAPPPSAP